MNKLIPIFAIIGLLLGWSDWSVAKKYTDVLERECYLVMPEPIPLPKVEIVK